MLPAVPATVTRVVPNFLGDSNVVAGVTSYGMNVACAGTGGVFRMDKQNVLDFVQPFLE